MMDQERNCPACGAQGVGPDHVVDECSAYIGVESFKDELQRALMNALLITLPPARSVDWGANQSGNQLLREAVRTACAAYTGWDSLAKQTFEYEYDAEARKTVIHVSGPPEIMERIGFGPDPDFADKVDVTVSLKKEDEG